MDTSLTIQNKPVTLYHRRHIRRSRGKALSHLVPAAVLLISALGAVASPEPLSLVVWIEFIIGAAYLVLMVRELRHLQHQHLHHEQVAWLEIAAAGILALEGYHIWHRHHAAAEASGEHRVHILPWLYGVIAVWYLLLAFGVVRILERRHLHLHNEGFSGRLTLFGAPFSYRWSEVAGVESTNEADVIIHRSDGQTNHLSFAELHEGSAHRDRLVAYAADKVGVAGELAS
ncbi:hypothetical protein [Hymenobacter sp. GOD-10R]|uniref:hypothetical protein n=1 Tax=Hymenobacter sp. GOD-10R TaxID=3093922 RepID=UPI002D7A0109|nr:hypothetical protein [Hymenobacter sp. GOD-10R]WRQ30036.1 hypothetical protein SD425_07155 [Hymenobacter sp. GOD-10R]